jgi:hypothetical protein
MAAVPQKHKIMRQVLELRGCSEDDARRAQADLRETYYRRLLPLIDKVCSELGAPGRIDRIERLEIDLGAVPLEALESAVAGKFEAAFAGRLAAAIEGVPELDADLELFERFIRTGTVPWWVEASDRAALDASLERLLARAPQALRRALRAAPDPPRVLRRIALAYPDRLLGELAAVLAPALALNPVAEPLAAALQEVRGARAVWWEELLQQALEAHGAAPAAPRSRVPAAASAGSLPVAQAGAMAFLRALLARVARRLAIDERALHEDLQRALPAQSRARETIASLSREIESGGEAVSRARETTPQLERTMARLETLLASHAALLARLREIRRLPLYLQAHALAVLEAAASEAGIALPAQRSKESRRKLEEEARLEARAQPETAFSDADAIYVDNAGLVILWPFLERFFDHAGLLEEKAFRDAAARQRAVGLLHYLASGEAPQAEPPTPLNKVLCGMPLEEVFEFGAPMTEAETEACDELLAAVIGNAPILRRMSSGGFRASFLLRKGQLGTLDGVWLLRVERETHDVVLERFPWSFQIVKLPWMEALMQVEW